MNLLIDARNKSQQAQNGAESSASEHPSGQENLADAAASPAKLHFERSRNIGRNLFSAKHPAQLARAGINRNLLIALGVTALLLIAGAAYVWYSVSTAITPPQRMVYVPPPAEVNNTLAIQKPPSNLVPDIAPQQPVPSTPITTKTNSKTISTKPARPARKLDAKKTLAPSKAAARSNDLVQIQTQAEPIDPLLNNAYAAYRAGKFDLALHGYRKALKLDARNIDAILGLAVIAQQHGANAEAAYHYSQALELDPRNAVANAGISALSSADNQESRLKYLLKEQQNSSALHFALGNFYAGQARWGEAQQSYANAYQLEPDNAELAFNFAVGLDQLGKKESAVKYYQRALQLDQSRSAGFDHAQIELRVQELTR